MAAYRYVVVDVFTDRPLAGNQLAVFTDARAVPEALLQPLAREVAFSEVAYVYPPEGEGHARIRIFSPQRELAFAGHPTLGTAFVLAAPLQLSLIALETGAGVVPVELTRDEAGRILSGRMAQRVPTWEPFAGEAALLAALSVEGSALPVEVYDNGIRHAFVELASPEAVAALAPDHAGLAPLGAGANCYARDGGRWKLRMFGSAIGMVEDPATGSAVGPLAVHLARHGRIAFGQEIVVEQGAEIGRPSTLRARAEGGPGEIERVEVSGSAVVVARGEFSLPAHGLDLG